MHDPFCNKEYVSWMLIVYWGVWRGGYIPHLPSGTPTRGQGKGKLHLFHIDPCTSHAFLTFLVDGQSQLGQLKSTLTTQQQEPDL